MALLGVAACAIPGAGDINLSGCIRDCNTWNKVCFDEAEVSCEPATSCFDSLETCFDEADACSKGCRDCEDKGTCTSEKKCNYTCEDIAHQCSKGIDECVDLQVACVEGKADNSLDCVDTLTECISVCIEETEDQLK